MNQTNKLHRFSKPLDDLPPSGIRAFFDLVLEKQDIISLGVGEPDFKTPARISKAGIESITSGKTCYTSNKGLKELRLALQGYLKKQNAIDYDAEEEILICNGASEGVDLVFRSLFNPGDEVIVPEPSYVCYTPLLSLCGVDVKRMDTSKTNFIPDPAAIRAQISDKTRAIVLCSPSNPTGVCVPEAVLKEIADIAKAEDLWIISDEIYAELQYENPVKSISHFAGKENSIIISGFSKAFAMTGWRLGYVAGPESVVSRCLKIHQYAALCAPTMAQFAAVEALKEPFRELDKMKAAYNQRRLYIIDQIKDMGFDMPRPTGAFYCFPNVCSTGMTGTEFATQLLKETNVAVVPGEGFGLGGLPHIRICYAYPDKDVKEALKRMGKFVKKLSIT
eukprot:COSAG01_NODE_2_length_63927_cov_1357.611941_6_plen_392_part_00